jgi:hypothetical protein
VSMSISGQNERWSRLDTYQPPAASSSGQNGGPAATNGTAPSSGASANAASGTSGALSEGISFALMALTNDWGNGPASRTAGQAGGPSGASPSPAQDGGNLASRLMTDGQSLVSVLTGTTAAPAAHRGASAGTATRETTGPTGTPQQTSRAVTSDRDTVTAASGSARPAGGPPPPPPLWDANTANPGTNTGRGNPGNYDAIQQRFAQSAYAANGQSGLDSSVTASLADINV